MAICAKCEQEVSPGDKVTIIVDGQWMDFCSDAHAHDYQHPKQAAEKPASPPSTPAAAAAPQPSTKRRSPRSKSAS